MNIVGYLVTMANLQNLVKVGSPLKDTLFHLASLEELTNKLKSIPDFPLEGYRSTGLQKHGKLAIYASKNLRDFIYDKRGNPEEEGAVLELQYCDSTECSNKFNTVSYFIYGEKIDANTIEEVNKHIKDLAARGPTRYRNKRSFVDKLIPRLYEVIP